MLRTQELKGSNTHTHTHTHTRTHACTYTHTHTHTLHIMAKKSKKMFRHLITRLACRSVPQGWAYGAPVYPIRRLGMQGK